MKLHHRATAALAGSILAMSGAVALAAPASAAPSPTFGKACPAGDSDPLLGGLQVKRWSLRGQIGTTQCSYNVKICNNGWWTNCTNRPFEVFTKVWRG